MIYILTDESGWTVGVITNVARLSPGPAHRIAVRACNSSGCSPPSFINVPASPVAVWLYWDPQADIVESNSPTDLAWTGYNFEKPVHEPSRPLPFDFYVLVALPLFLFLLLAIWATGRKKLASRTLIK